MADPDRGTDGASGGAAEGVPEVPGATGAIDITDGALATDRAAGRAGTVPAADEAPGEAGEAPGEAGPGAVQAAAAVPPADDLSPDAATADGDAPSDGATAAGDPAPVERATGDHTPAGDAAANGSAAADDAAPGGSAAGPAPAAPADDADADAAAPPLRKVLEAILLVVDEPVPEVNLAQVLEEPRANVLAALQALAEEYARDGRGFELRNVSGGWRLYTAADCAPYVERFVLDGQQARLTQAALETLAVIAYRQPVSRQSVAAIRGVNVDGVVRTLLSRGLIAEAGEEGPGGAHLYVTTPYFLERLGLRSLDDLPNLAPLLPTNIDDLAENA